MTSLPVECFFVDRLLFFLLYTGSDRLPVYATCPHVRRAKAEKLFGEDRPKLRSGVVWGNERDTGLVGLIPPF